MQKMHSDFRVRKNDLIIFSLIVLLHLIVATYLKEIVGFDITANPGSRQWDWWWQTVPADLLVSDLARSLWFLHSQPPVFNLYGAFFFRLFPQFPMSAMHYGNILLGALTSGAIYFILLIATRKRRLSAIVAFCLALSLGPFLFEAYILYDILTAFLVTVSVCMLAFYTVNQRLVFVIGFILTVCILVLTRSVYHIVIVPVAITVLILSSKENWKKILVTSLIISILPLTWFAKNQILYGFFGASSWSGFALWKVASDSYSPDEIHSLADQGLISPVATDVEILRPASAYEAYGFHLSSDIPVLARDDRHNINMIEVAKSYQHSALNLIRREPKRYFEGAMTAYKIYSIPSFKFKHHVVNAEKLWPSLLIASGYLEGSRFSPYHGNEFGSFYFFLVPVCIIAYIFMLLIQIVFTKQGLLEILQERALSTWMIFLIIYTTLISILFETGENGRERFYIEQLMIVFLLSALVWGWSWYKEYLSNKGE